MTIVGFLVAFYCLLFVKDVKVHKNGFSFILEFGGNWGGISLGAISFCGKYSDSYLDFYEHTRRHEFGHSIQNLIFGPFMLFVVGLPSLIRSNLYKKGKIKRDYDDVWFEYTASKWGHAWVNKIEGTNVQYIYTFVRKKG